MQAKPTPTVRDFVALYDAAEEASEAAAQLGYDPIKAVQTLPVLIHELSRIGDLHQYLPHDVAETITAAMNGAKREPPSC